MKKWLLSCFVLILAFGCQQKPSKQYAIGRDPTWYPLELGSKTPYLNALTNALVQKIGKKERIPLHIVDVGAIDLISYLAQEEYAAIFTSLNPNIETEALYSFSEPILLLGPVLVVPIDSHATTLADLADKRVGINQFDNTILIVQKYPNIQSLNYENMPVALEDLTKGNLEGVLIDRLDARAFVQNLYPTRLKIASAPLDDQGIRLMTLKDKHPHLIKKFNAGLKELQGKSTFEKLREKFWLTRR